MLKAHSVPRAVYFAIAAEARRRGIPFGGHLAETFRDSLGVTPFEAADSGVSVIDHAQFRFRSCFGDSASVARCQPLAAHLRRHGTWVVPTWTVSFIRETRATIRVGKKGTPAVRIGQLFDTRMSEFWAGTPLAANWLHEWATFEPVPAGVRIDLDTMNSAKLRDWRGGGDADSLNEPYLERTDGVGVMQIAQQVGMPLLAGTDTPWGFALHVELAIYAAEGLTPLAALQSATLNPAKLLHGTDSLGTVAQGKLADLVLLDANPLADITNTTQISAVVANGRYFDRAALDGLATQVKASVK
jgi:hypothetical protein